MIALFDGLLLIILLNQSDISNSNGCEITFIRAVYADCIYAAIWFQFNSNQTSIAKRNKFYYFFFSSLLSNDLSNVLIQSSLRIAVVEFVFFFFTQFIRF